jgi:translocation and assembly module TamB
MSGLVKRWTRRAVILIVALAVVVAVIVATGLAEHWTRSALIRQIEQGTGARVEIGAFHFKLWGLRAEIDNLTIHGLESAGQPPLLHADRLDAQIRII